MCSSPALHPLCVELYAGATPSFDDLYDAFATALPLLTQLRETPQDPEWHAEGDVHIHSSMTLDMLYQELERSPRAWSSAERAQLVRAAHVLSRRREKSCVSGCAKSAPPSICELGRCRCCSLALHAAVPAATPGHTYIGAGTKVPPFFKVSQNKKVTAKTKILSL